MYTYWVLGNSTYQLLQFCRDICPFLQRTRIQLLNSQWLLFFSCHNAPYIFNRTPIWTVDRPVKHIHTLCLWGHAVPSPAALTSQEKILPSHIWRLLCHTWHVESQAEFSSFHWQPDVSFSPEAAETWTNLTTEKSFFVQKVLAFLCIADNMTRLLCNTFSGHVSGCSSVKMVFPVHMALLLMVTCFLM